MMKTSTKPTKAPSRPYGEPVTAHSDGDAPKRPTTGAFLEITKIVREHVALESSPGGEATLGSMIDDYLAECALAGQEVQTVKLDLEPGYWRVLADHIKKTEDDLARKHG